MREFFQMCSSKEIPAEVLQILQPNITEAIKQWGEVLKTQENNDHKENLEHIKFVSEMSKEYIEIFSDPKIDEKTRQQALAEAQRLMDMEFQEKKETKIMRMFQWFLAFIAVLAGLFMIGKKGGDGNHT